MLVLEGRFKIKTGSKNMDETLNAEVRQTDLILTLVSGAIVGLAVGGFGSWLLFIPDMGVVEFLAATFVIGGVGVSPFLGVMYMNRRGFVPTEVWAEEDRLVVQSPSEWWFKPEKQFHLEVESAEQAEAGLVITGTLSRWWDWGRHEVRVEPEEADALDAWLGTV
ncbi:hypothetical protein GGP85_003122 [Salinibacter ruber]|nr:hypothetical protein [Salinibacter ruber]